jgi:hypothetical protein
LFFAEQTFGTRKGEEEYSLFSRLNQEPQLQQQLEDFTNPQTGEEKNPSLQRE